MKSKIKLKCHVMTLVFSTAAFLAGRDFSHAANNDNPPSKTSRLAADYSYSPATAGVESVGIQGEKIKPWRVWDGPSAYATKTLMIGRRRFFYVDEGSGRTVVLIRNTPFGCERKYDLQIAALVKAGYRAIVPYRAGTGGSDFCDHVSVTTESEDTFAVLDHLGVKKFVVLGHCQGARVAQQMLLRRPEAVEAFVNYDHGTFGRIKTAIMPGPFSADLPKPFVLPETRDLWKKNEAKLRELNRAWDYPSDYNLEYTLRLLMFEQKNKELCRRTAMLGDPRDLLVPKGKYCKVPVLSITSGRGRFTQDDPIVQQRQKEAPAENIKMVVITESGHQIGTEQPELFNKALLDFLATLPPYKP